MKSVLDVQVSCFKDYRTADLPADINLLTWLRSENYRQAVERVRQTVDKTERDSLKSTLPAITPSGTFSYRKADSLIKHSGLIQFDVDLQDNQHITNYHDLKEQLCRIENVAYVGLSVSGTGYWGLIPIACPEKHTAHFAALKKDFGRLGIAIDEKPGNVASLRGYSYDPEPYLNHEATVYTKTREQQPAAVQYAYQAGIPDNPFEVAERILQRQGVSYQPGNRHNYLWQFARLCNRYGVSREECRAYVDTVYAYDERTNWLASYRRYATETGMYCQEPADRWTDIEQRQEPGSQAGHWQPEHLSTDALTLLFEHEILYLT